MCRLFTAMHGMWNTNKDKYETEETCYIWSLVVNTLRQESQMEKGTLWTFSIYIEEVFDFEIGNFI